jgi:hypothetical protein
MLPSIVLTGCLCALPSGSAAGQEDGAAPAWLRDEFAARRVAAGAGGRSFALLEDGCLDLRVAQRGGFPALRLLQPGTILSKLAGELEEGASAFRQLSSLEPEELAALSLGEGPDARPCRLAQEVPLALGRVLFVRTIRAELGGGGAVARVRCERASKKDEPVSVELELDVLALDPAASLLPRRDEGWYLQDAGEREGVLALFPIDVYGHPSLGTLDVLRLDRDHLEWGGVLPRDLESAGVRALRPIARARGAAAPLDGGGRVFAEGLGFARHLELRPRPRAPGPSELEWEWRELKADRLLDARPFPLLVLDAGGEPVQGAWVCARGSARSGGAGERPEQAALYCVQSDSDGRALLPVDRRDDERTIEVFAFEAGRRARFGSRRGALVEKGGGGECVVLLDRVESAEARVEPPPGFRCFVGAQLARGSFLLDLAADGTLRLPAAGESATLALGPPYVARSFDLELSPGAVHRISGTLAAGRERRIRLVDARDGGDVLDYRIEPAIEAAGREERGVATASVIELPGSVLVPPELAGGKVRFRVTAPGFRPRDVEVAADAPRDQELLLERE